MVSIPQEAKRISRMEMFLGIALVVAERSTCNRAKVGAVLVRNSQDMSIGYVGSPSGQPHCHDVGCLIENGGCVRTIHAEVNAIVSAAREGVMTAGAEMYCTHSPCLECAKIIANAGIARLVYLEEYRLTEGLQYLREKSRVEVYQAKGRFLI